VLADGKKLDYAFGLFVSDDGGKHEVYHSGATAGWRAFLTRKIDDDLSIAVLCNRGDAGAGGLVEKVAAVFVKPAQQPPPTQPNGNAATQLIGLYRDPATDAIFRIIGKDDGLHLGLRAAGSGPLLVPLGANRYRIGSSIELRFEDDGLHLIGPHKPEALYVRAADATPTAAQLGEYTGMYSSDEVGASYAIAIEDGKLVVRVTPVRKVKLEPTYADGFLTESGDPIRFTRDSTGHIIGADIKADYGPAEGSARVERMHFVRK
jgi:hypothetical protein